MPVQTVGLEDGVAVDGRTSSFYRSSTVGR